jgi:hypothetical protein
MHKKRIHLFKFSPPLLIRGFPLNQRALEPYIPILLKYLHILSIRPIIFPEPGIPKLPAQIKCLPIPLALPPKHMPIILQFPIAPIYSNILALQLILLKIPVNTQHTIIVIAFPIILPFPLAHLPKVLQFLIRIKNLALSPIRAPIPKRPLIPTRIKKKF